MSPHRNHPSGYKIFCKFTGLSPSMVNFSKFFNFNLNKTYSIYSPLYYSQLSLLNNYYDVSLHYLPTLSINLQYINVSICYLLNRYRKFVYEEV